MSAYENISIKQRIFLVSQGIFQLLLAVFITTTVWLMAFNRNWQLLHTWHVFLSTIGFSFLMAESVALLNAGNTFVLGCSRFTKKILHGICMSCATVAVIAGISIKIIDKNDNNRDHFTTVHGILGFTAFVLTICSCLGGLIAALSKFVYTTFSVKPYIIKNIHIFFGVSAYVIGSVTLGYGLHDYFTEASYETNLGLIVILGIYVSISLIGPTVTFFRL